MTLRVFCVVEGHGDVFAFPVLLRRLCAEVFGLHNIAVEPPYRLPKGRITIAEHLVPVLELGISRLNGRAEEGDILLLLVSRDADEDCPVKVAATIAAIAATVAGTTICKAVIPNVEYEAWLLAGATPLASHADCSDAAYDVADADAVKNPKAEFEKKVLLPDRFYAETIDQPKFSAQISLSEETFAKSRSLRRLRDVIEQAVLS